VRNLFRRAFWRRFERVGLRSCASPEEPAHDAPRERRGSPARIHLSMGIRTLAPFSTRSRPSRCSNPGGRSGPVAVPCWRPAVNPLRRCCGRDRVATLTRHSAADLLLVQQTSCFYSIDGCRLAGRPLADLVPEARTRSDKRRSSTRMVCDRMGGPPVLEGEPYCPAN
jgi:hypothetical protein